MVHPPCSGWQVGRQTHIQLNPTACRRVTIGDSVRNPWCWSYRASRDNGQAGKRKGMLEKREVVLLYPRQEGPTQLKHQRQGLWTSRSICETQLSLLEWGCPVLMARSRKFGLGLPLWDMHIGIGWQWYQGKFSHPCLCQETKARCQDNHWAGPNPESIQDQSSTSRARRTMYQAVGVQSPQGSNRWHPNLWLLARCHHAG